MVLFANGRENESEILVIVFVEMWIQKTAFNKEHINLINLINIYKLRVFFVTLIRHISICRNVGLDILRYEFQLLKVGFVILEKLLVFRKKLLKKLVKDMKCTKMQTSFLLLNHLCVF